MDNSFVFLYFLKEYFLKTMVIIIEYPTFFMSLLIALYNVREAVYIIKYSKEPMSAMNRIAKKIVFAIDSVILIASSTMIYLTFDWQKSLVSGVRASVVQQPAFAVPIILLALYPILVVRKLAAEQQSE